MTARADEYGLTPNKSNSRGCVLCYLRGDTTPAKWYHAGQRLGYCDAHADSHIKRIEPARTKETQPLSDSLADDWDDYGYGAGR